MDKVRYGVIGLGFFGEKHAEVLSSMPEVELAAVCTCPRGRLDEIATRFAVPKTFTDYRDMLAETNVDAVSIVTHVDAHRDIAIDCLKAGKHVLLEKPMAGTVADCDAILAAAAAARGIFMVGHICRFDPRVGVAKESIDEGSIGKVLYMYARRNLPANIGGEVLEKISPLLGDGIHDTDVMLWLSGAKITSAYARNVRVRDHRYPDIGCAMYGFDSGAAGVIETVWNLPDNTPYAIDARMEIIGDEGAAYIDCANSGLTISGAGGTIKPDTGYWPSMHGLRVGALRNELGYFTNCIASGEAPTIITPEESRSAVAAICAAEASAASGKVMPVA